ncbi:lipid-A-disaccharide synthase, partial [Nitrospinae bacterium AH_259_B05_G02_I21]|nr:lipid-A-disaccharide synthase [Nitrospinae bacterium AH_259_B05_G02_I21]
YYVTPQLWASRPWRARLMRLYVDRCLVVLPFEADFYRARHVEAEFVGHPLLDLVTPPSDRAGFVRNVGLDPARPVIGLLPGSRQAEIRYLLPTLRGAAERLLEARPDLQFLVPIAPSVSRGQVEHYLDGHTLPLALVEGRAHEVMAVADLALIVSGTATLEAAILGTPMIIIYKGSFLSWLVIMLLSRVSTYGLPNLVAGRPIVPELLQREATPEALAREALTILDEPAVRQTMVVELDKVRGLLGDKGATKRAAQRILDLL